MEMEIDIYDWKGLHLDPIYKEYFNQDYDLERERVDFQDRELIRRSNLKSAFKRYVDDPNIYVDSGWEEESGPFHDGRKKWSKLQTARRIIELLVSGTQRLD